MTFTMFFVGWWILWLPVVTILVVRWVLERWFVENDIDRLIAWEEKHWNQ